MGGNCMGNMERKELVHLSKPPPSHISSAGADTVTAESMDDSVQ
jgi:hypothetical protein